MPRIQFGGPDPFAGQNAFMPVPGLGGLGGGPAGGAPGVPGGQAPFQGGSGVPPFGLQEALGGGTFDPLGGGMVDSGIHGQPGGNAIPGGGGGLLGKLWNFMKDNPDLILGVGTIANNAWRQSKMDKQREEAIDAARARREETAPLRSHALKQLMEPVNKDVDLTDEFADASNPFSRGR